MFVEFYYLRTVTVHKMLNIPYNNKKAVINKDIYYIFVTYIKLVNS